MFSGKTEELIQRLRDAERTRERVQAFKPDMDTRYSDSGEIVSHSGWRRDAHCIEGPDGLIPHLDPATDVVGVDEAQFFGRGITSAVVEVAKQGIRTIIAGLELDYRGHPFGSIPHLLRLTPNTKKLYARCTVCNKEADRTQRLIDGEPAHIDDPLVVVGGRDMYEPRCREHHTVRTN